VPCEGRVARREMRSVSPWVRRCFRRPWVKRERARWRRGGGKRVRM